LGGWRKSADALSKQFGISEPSVNLPWSIAETTRAFFVQVQAIKDN
jgi:hypothetical protein